MSDLLTPRQVAESLGVSESSLKRWCDRGVLPVKRTPGGHRRLPLSGVVEFLRTSERALVRPEAIGLPKHVGVRRLAVESHADDFYSALIAGELPNARRVIFDTYLRGRSLSRVCDEIIATSLHRIGNEWKAGTIQVFQEHRACDITQCIVHELHSLVGMPSADAPVALGAGVSGDVYSLPTLMIESVLREAGWRATSYGCNLPLTELLAVAKVHKPRFIWLSASEIADQAGFIRDYLAFYDQVPSSISVVVGGRALVPEIRAELRYASYCDNLQQLVEFSQAIKSTGLSSRARKDAS